MNVLATVIPCARTNVSRNKDGNESPRHCLQAPQLVTPTATPWHVERIRSNARASRSTTHNYLIVYPSFTSSVGKKSIHNSIFWSITSWLDCHLRSPPSIGWVHGQKKKVQPRLSPICSHLSRDSILFFPSFENTEWLSVTLPASKTDPFRKVISMSVWREGLEYINYSYIVRLYLTCRLNEI